MSITLNRMGFEMISQLQDKYHFSDTFAVEDNEAAKEFCQALLDAEHFGLSLDKEDHDFCEAVVDKL